MDKKKVSQSLDKGKRVSYIWDMVIHADILTQELHQAAVAWKTLEDQECAFETLLQPAANRCLKNGWTDEQVAKVVNEA